MNYLLQMNGIPYIREGVTVNDARLFTIESFQRFMEGSYKTKISIIHEFVYLTDFPKRPELVTNLEENPYHLLFYMIAPFYYVDNGILPIRYLYFKKNNHYLPNEALRNLPERFKREYNKEEQIEYIQLPGCKWHIGWIDEPWIYEYVRNLYKHVWESTPQERGKRIYISRHVTRVSQRAILNEDELKPVLKEIGISYYVLENMTFIDTIRLFKSAEFVTGPHGAGFAWLVFCDRGTIFLEIYKDKPLKEYYKDMSFKCNLQFLRFTGVIDDPLIQTPIYPNEVDDGHMIIDIPAYKLAIQNILGKK